MARPDLNLLVTLDVLLEEGSVTRARVRHDRRPSAMSRHQPREPRATPFSRPPTGPTAHAPTVMVSVSASW